MRTFSERLCFCSSIWAVRAMLLRKAVWAERRLRNCCQTKPALVAAAVVSTATNPRMEKRVAMGR